MANFVDVLETRVICVLILVLTVCHYVEGQVERSDGFPSSTILAVVNVLIVIVLCAIAIACYCYHRRQQFQREVEDIKNNQDNERESDPKVHEEVNPLYGETPQMSGKNREKQVVHIQPSAAVSVAKTNSQISEDRRDSDDYVDIDAIPPSASETQHTTIQEYHTYLGNNRDDTNDDYTKYNTDASTKDTKYKSLQKLETSATNYPHEKNSQASQTSDPRDSEDYEEVENKISESEETSLSTIQEYHTYLGNNRDDTNNGYTEYNTDASTKDTKYKSLQKYETETSATNPNERNSQASQTSDRKDSEGYEDVLNKISESEETSLSTIHDCSTWITDSHKDSPKPPNNNNMQADDQLEYGATEAAVTPLTESSKVTTGLPGGLPLNKIRVRQTKDVYVNQKIVQQRSPAALDY